MPNTGNTKNENMTQFSKSRKGGGTEPCTPSDNGLPSYATSISGAGRTTPLNAGWLEMYATPAKDAASAFPPQKSGHSFVLNGDNYEKSKGLGWFIAGLFIIADLAGGGLVALPTAMVRFGFVLGFFGTILMTCIVCYTGYVLGQNWLILQRRWPHLYATGHCRKPYPEIGLRALGKRAMNGVSACLNITQFGVAVVYLLLSAKNIRDFLKAFFHIDLSFCVIVIVVAIALLPITFLKSPQDFWGFVVVAAVTTSLAVILILVASAYDYPTCSANAHIPAPTFTNYFLALGTFIFSYGGHAVFPTIQHDMKKPHEFTKSSILAFTIVALMYTPVAVMGYLTYGDSLRDSIINSLQSVEIQQTVNMLITVHCILTLTIVFNPINQQVEEFFKVPHHFSIKRILVRSATMLAVVFVGETLPRFGPLLDLVGGSTQTMISIIFPAVFYLYLKCGEEMEREREVLGSDSKLSTISSNGVKYENVDEELITFSDILTRVDRKTLICCTFVIAFGVIGGAAATFSAIRTLLSEHFEPPCYIAPFLNTPPAVSASQTACCGRYQNVSRFADVSDDILQYCSIPDYRIFGASAEL